MCTANAAMNPLVYTGFFLAAVLWVWGIFDYNAQIVALNHTTYVGIYFHGNGSEWHHIECTAATCDDTCRSSQAFAALVLLLGAVCIGGYTRNRHCAWGLAITTGFMFIVMLSIARLNTGACIDHTSDQFGPTYSNHTTRTLTAENGAYALTGAVAVAVISTCIACAYPPAHTPNRQSIDLGEVDATSVALLNLQT